MVNECIRGVNQLGVAANRDLWSNVCVVGGSTLAQGFQERLQAELAALAPPRHAFRAVPSPHARMHAARARTHAIPGNATTCPLAALTTTQCNSEGDCPAGAEEVYVAGRLHSLFVGHLRGSVGHPG